MREIAGLDQPQTFDPSNPPPPYCWKEFDPMELEGGVTVNGVTGRVTVGEASDAQYYDVIVTGAGTSASNGTYPWEILK